MDRLLRDWRWLFAGEFQLLAVNAFGDLFVQDIKGSVYRLDVIGGNISEVATSTSEFQEAAKDSRRMKDWFLEDLTDQAEQKGYCPRKEQCVGYKIPPVFKESADMTDNMYVADLYEYVSLMGDLHRQIKDIPDGGTMRIKIGPSPH